jgi:pyruvate/2-oxoglutarate dehydrogenase complex dihydrolipoamide acyltransferase (E2) component
MPKVRKLFGENPEQVHVLDTFVVFDAQGEAEVKDEVAEVFGQIPGYEVLGAVEEPEEPEEPSEDNEEEAEEPEAPEAPSEEEAPKPKRPARKAPAKK